jgi:hypothetical protein
MSSVLMGKSLNSMKVFISWSGEISNRVANLFSEWIPCVVQSADPWLSSNNLDPGSIFFEAVQDELGQTSLGIVCLTQENREKPWILFESGALAKGLTKNRVYTFLIDLVPADVTGPLANFQHTKPEKDDVWKLVQSLNRYAAAHLQPSVLINVFNTFWPQFEKQFSEIVKDKPNAPKGVEKNENEVLGLILDQVRSVNNRLSNVENSTKLRQSFEPPPMFSNENIGTIVHFVLNGMKRNDIAKALASSFPRLPESELLAAVDTVMIAMARGVGVE